MALKDFLHILFIFLYTVAYWGQQEKKLHIRNNDVKSSTLFGHWLGNLYVHVRCISLQV